MKKIMVKNLLIISLAVGALVVIGNNVYAEGDHEEIDWIDDSPGGGGNSATCYASYTPGGGGIFGIGADPEIWRCGDCVRVRAKNAFDSGTCRF